MTLNKIYKRDGTLYEDLAEGIVAMLDFEALQVASDVLPNGYWVHTIWLGMDRNSGVAPPLIFETVVYPSADPEDDSQLLASVLASTEQEALANHAAMRAQWSQTAA